MFLAEPDGLIVPDRMLQLGENVFVSERLAVGIDVGVPAGHVKERGHLRYIVRDNQRMRLTGWLECVVAGGRDPVMLQIAPFTPDDEAVLRERLSGLGYIS